MKFSKWNCIRHLIAVPLILSCAVGCGGSGDPKDTPTQQVDDQNSKNPDILFEAPNEVWSGSNLQLFVQVLNDDNNNASFSWKVLSGPALDLSNHSTGALEVTVPNVDEDTNWTLEVTITDEGKTASKQVTIKIKRKVNSVTLTGIVTDQPVANPKVSATVGDVGFIATSNARGEYSITLEIDEANKDQLVQLIATDPQNETIQFVSQLNTLNTLYNTAGDDRILNSRENFRVNITNVTTAEYGLIRQANLRPLTSTELASARAGVDPSQQLVLAALLKLVADNDEYSLPASVSSTRALANNKAEAEAFEAEVREQDPDIIAQTIEEIITDPNLIDADGDGTRPTPEHPLQGAWQLEGEPDVAIIIKDGKWVHIQTKHKEDEEDGQPGYEIGDFSWDAASKLMTVTLDDDTNGVFGWDEDLTTKAEVVNDKLVLTFEQEQQAISFTRIEDINNPLVGAYYEGDLGGEFYLTVFKEDGYAFELEYITSNKGVSGSNYSYDSKTNKVHLDLYLDQLGLARDPDFVARAQNNTLQYKDGDEGGVMKRVLNLVEPIAFDEQNMAGNYTLTMDNSSDKLHPIALALNADKTATVTFNDRAHTGAWRISQGQLLISGSATDYQYAFGVIVTPTRETEDGMKVLNLTFVEPEVSNDNDDPRNHGFSLATLKKQ
ncbi:hypothetical protein [Pseudoalteromonas sp. OOF1S-7]|uniref:hypothetical protein n=1 Tax=Pseudoalteromonas sp. OOF1S-7 TaxID=2917757 RepID=UPI001EF484ED|nr:hypothetical protein [Pseudoalteromonas sp. OOF1S-7]MCG7534161.1 hypothetical protein [Pseudoalteromonas sp. OOF1S-7]